MDTMCKTSRPSMQGQQVADTMKLGANVLRSGSSGIASAETAARWGCNRGLQIGQTCATKIVPSPGSLQFQVRFDARDEPT